ncbi:putative HhH-GPD family protein [Kribbella kalugense]|uniref:Putative HhH-GPD family protein n=2 Tax=Kribbella kalugense TaxID=2512221 RepID=A0A4R7ZEZ6_9ACTN|nr:putative HhH-GPD family protein [Kribbella kalugense]
MGGMLRELHLTGNPDADKLLNDDPFALLVGMLLDQQYPMEHAFSGPLKLANRMDGFDLHKIAATDLDTFVELSVTPPAIHRYGGSMGRRVHALAQHIIDNYDGETTNIWLAGRPKPDGAEVLKRLKALPGFGEQKAKIFLALLGKQRGIQPKGWREAAGHYGDRGSRRSIADVTDPASLGEVRNFKKAAKAAAKDVAGA